MQYESMPSLLIVAARTELLQQATVPAAKRLAAGPDLEAATVGSNSRANQPSACTRGAGPLNVKSGHCITCAYNQTHWLLRPCAFEPWNGRFAEMIVSQRLSDVDL